MNAICIDKLEHEVRSWDFSLNDVDAERVGFEFDRLAELRTFA